ncbi:M56 family metallopeptidase [Reichenbachiella sp. MALMAid0571]|uniref:M56 family metallopeptidase n=1 Tax=Reichenbachiella sp. MALMAid0571 TaxID=3143939 RepID=UPI0032DEDB10
MKEFTFYLIQNIVLMAIFFTSYRLLYKRYSSHSFKRYFLITAIFLSTIIPLIHIDITLPQEVSIFSTPPKSIKQYIDDSIKPKKPYDEVLARKSEPLTLTESKTILPDENLVITNSKDFATWTYFGLAFIFFWRLLSQLFSFYRVLKRSSKILYNGDTIYLDRSNKITGASFFNFIVIAEKYRDKDEFAVIYAHERAHVQRLHSFDVLLSELCCTLLWVNPFYWLFRKEIELNHELEADVLASQKNDVKEYSFTLLSLANSNFRMLNANHFASSNIKYRITQLLDQPYKKISKVRISMIFLILSLVVWQFSCELHEDVIDPITSFNGNRETIKNIKSISTRFLGHYDDLEHKNTRLISKAFFLPDGSLEKVEKYLNYPYNFEEPVVMDFYVEPDLKNLLQVMDGLPFEIAENSILYGNDWPKYIAAIPEKRKLYDFQNKSTFDCNTETNESGFPTEIFFTEKNDDFPLKDWGYSFKETFDYQGKLVSKYSHIANNRHIVIDDYFSYQGDKIVGVSGKSAQFKFEYNEGKLSKTEKYVNTELVNTRKYYYNDSGVKIRTEVFNRYGKPEYTVQFEFEYYENAEE